MTSSHSDLQTLRILIIEDDNFSREILKHAIDSIHDVYAADTLEEGWNLYLHHSPHIVFLDVRLPDGNGHTLARRIKEHNASCFIVMETASGSEENLIQAENNQVNGFMAKPFDIDRIQSYIDLYKSHVSKN